jgi:hypothetical protein
MACVKVKDLVDAPSPLLLKVNLKAKVIDLAVLKGLA